MYYVYILCSIQDNSYYVGSTSDVEKRFSRHNQGRSKYTKSKCPWELVHVEEYESRSAATKREREIKSKKRRSYIDELVRTSRM